MNQNPPSSMGKILIRKARLYTSIQDLGRSGYRNFGVPVSGAMDQRSAQLANLLVNNPPDAAVLEITLTGPELIFSADCLVSMTGANLSPELDGHPVKMNTPFAVRQGQMLHFGRHQYGVRAYLAVRGGLQNEKVLGSASQYFPVTEKGKLDAGDELSFTNHPVSELPNTAIKTNADHFQKTKLKAFPGPEFHLLSPDQKKALLHPFAIGENNRMGYQLTSGADLQNEHSIITSPVVPGTVQLTPAGKLIELMRDGQVTGGYPRILQLGEDSINCLAQKATGMEVWFRLEEV